MKRLTVVIPEPIQAQITAQVLHIANDSVDNALACEQRLRAAIQKLGEVSGHAFDENATDRLGHTVQKMVFEGTYLVHFKVDDNAGILHVINFRHGARLPRMSEP